MSGRQAPGTGLGTSSSNTGGTPSWWGGASSPASSPASAPECVAVGLPVAWGSPATGGEGVVGPVWGGRGPSTPATRLGAGDGPARGTSGLGVQVTPATESGSGTPSGLVPGLGSGPQKLPRGARTLRQWWWSPLHESPDPLPRWLAELVLAYRDPATATGSAARPATSSGAPVVQALPRTVGDLVGTPLTAVRQAAVTRVAAALRGGGAR